jgi:hypothetical protein
LGLFLVLVLPWLIFRSTLPRAGGGEDYQGLLTTTRLLEGIQRIPFILDYFRLAMLNRDLFGIIWTLALVAGVLGFWYSRRGDVGCVTLLLLGHIGVNMAAYMIVAIDLKLHLDMSVDRVLMHMLPTATFLIAFGTAALFEVASGANRRGVVDE